MSLLIGDNLRTDLTKKSRNCPESCKKPLMQERTKLGERHAAIQHPHKTLRNPPKVIVPGDGVRVVGTKKTAKHTPSSDCTGDVHRKLLGGDSQRVGSESPRCLEGPTHKTPADALAF